jgi:hypothetical protein
MRIGVDFESVQFDQVQGQAEDCMDENIWLKCEDLKSTPGLIVGFEMTSHTNKSQFS